MKETLVIVALLLPATVQAQIARQQLAVVDAKRDSVVMRSACDDVPDANLAAYGLQNPPSPRDNPAALAQMQLRIAERLEFCRKRRAEIAQRKREAESAVVEAQREWGRMKGVCDGVPDANLAAHGVEIQNAPSRRILRQLWPRSGSASRSGWTSARNGALKLHSGSVRLHQQRQRKPRNSSANLQTNRKRVRQKRKNLSMNTLKNVIRPTWWNRFSTMPIQETNAVWKARMAILAELMYRHRGNSSSRKAIVSIEVYFYEVDGKLIERPFVTVDLTKYDSRLFDFKERQDTNVNGDPFTAVVLYDGKDFLANGFPLSIERVRRGWSLVYGKYCTGSQAPF
jgi:hypothetical protein